MNRIEDSVNLWKTIVSNKLLAKTNIILFLNKCDILKQKLDAGVSFGKYITSYGSRPNTFEGTSTCAYSLGSSLYRDAKRPPLRHAAQVPTDLRRKLSVRGVTVPPAPAVSGTDKFYVVRNGRSTATLHL